MELSNVLAGEFTLMVLILVFVDDTRGGMHDGISEERTVS